LDETQGLLRQEFAKSRELRDQIDKLIEEVEKLQENSRDVTRFSNENSKLRTVADNYNTLKASAKTLEKDNRSLVERVAKNERESKALNNKIDTLTRQGMALQAHVDELENYNRQLKSQVETKVST